MKEKPYIKALTIAGSDSGGGAGIQADLKTFSALGCYGMTAITAITAQNTIGVQSIYNLPIEIVKEQIQAIMEDMGTDVIKIGMLQSIELIDCIATTLSPFKERIPIVVDPVMVSKSGHNLLNENAVESLLSKIFPLATVITPNLPEASKLLKYQIRSLRDMEDAAKELCKTGPKAVVIKGGHLEHVSASDDCLWEADKAKATWFKGERVNTPNTHGTGCTFSAAIAAYLGHHKSIYDAVQLSKTYLSYAIKKGADYSLGQGHGPVYHFFESWPLHVENFNNKRSH